jgi:hypothetical protein
MTITVDYYFWLALGYNIGAMALAAGVIWLCFRYKRFGKVAFIVSLLAGATYDLTMCSNFIAHDLRSTSQPQQEPTP